ncbi:MAG: peptidase M4 family protein [Anaerolineales bacterium]|nr:peptidase M4 family protein [Anaerolineales bacterium]
MKKRITLTTIFVLIMLIVVVSSSAGSPLEHNSQFAPTPVGLEKIQNDANGNLEIVWNSTTNQPDFIRGQIPFSTIGLNKSSSPAAVAFTVVERYADLFQIQDPAQELVILDTETDDLGICHVTLGQVYKGVEVYNAKIKVHFSADTENIIAMSSNYVTGVSLTSVKPQIGPEYAIMAANTALPKGTIQSEPKLAITDSNHAVASKDATLVWVVDMQDDLIPARNSYFIDAINGNILEVFENLQTDRNRETYDAENGYDLPGTLARSEGDTATGDTDVDNAHDFAGETYDYFFNTHNRDSYDDAGATLISTANYGTGYRNAYWNGSQMVYGDGFAVEDVVAHELTHAVTEHTAGLEYRWQSGALNESFSDIFGVMVDRDDWLMGDDLPPDVLGGADAIRDLSDPPRFGQPDHTDDWLETCSDHEGVHTNSGITNKAFFNIATAISKEKAELIFYRTLTVYLDTHSTLAAAHSAAIQAAEDIYGSNSSEANAVIDGFDAVGLNSDWSPPANNCTCAATVALSDEVVFKDQMTTLQVAATLYRLRDEFSDSAAGGYYRDLYESHTGRISALLLTNPDLRAAGGQILQSVEPGLTGLMDGKGSAEFVSKQMVNNVLTFLKELAEADRSQDGGKLADTIEYEMGRIDWNHLAGLTFNDASDYLNTINGTSKLELSSVDQ